MPPIVAAVGAFATWFGTLGVVGQFAVRLGISLVLSAASNALMRRRLRGLDADRRFTVRAPVAPRNLIYGTVRTGGTIVYIHEQGQNLHLVIVLATHRVRSIGAVYFNGEEAIDADGAAIGRWTGLAFVDKRRGLPGQTAFADLIAAPDSEWTAAHRLTGCAAIHMRLVASRDAFPTGIPDIQVDIEGRDDVLDPRTGLRGYTSNPALCLADYMADPVFGLGIGIGEPDGIDTADLILAANICEEPIDLAAGGTEARYDLNGVVYLDDTPQASIEAMLTAMMGRAVFTGGRWRIFAGAYRVPTVTLTADDAIADGIRVMPRIPLRDNFNAVRGTFISPENGWQPDDYPPIRSAVYRAEDAGLERWTDLPLPFTTSASMAQRLAKIRLERQRRQMTVIFAGKMTCLRVAAGDTVMLTYARFGLAAKPFVVAAMNVRPDAEQGVTVELTLRETSPLVYDWDASEEQIYAAAPRPNLPSPFDVSPPGTPTVTESLFITRDGSGVRTLLTVSWAPSLRAVNDYEVEARRIANPAGTPTGDGWTPRGRTAETTLEIRDVQPGTWEVRVRAFSTLGVPSAFATRTVEVLGLSAPPQALTGATIQKAGGLAILKWDRSPDLDVRIGGAILIRHSQAAEPGLANSVKMDAVAGADAIAVVPLLPGAYLLIARDSSGLTSPPVIVRTDGAQVIDFAPVAALPQHPGWLGVRENVETSGTALILSDVAAPGVYTFDAGMDFGSVRRARLRRVIDVTALELAGTIDQRLEPIDRWDDFDGAAGAGVDVVVEHRTTNDDPSGSPVWSDWGRVDSTEVEARGVQFRAILSTESEDYNVFLMQLSAVADEVV